MKIRFVLATLFVSALMPFAAHADGTVSVYLQVEADTGTIFVKQPVNVGACSNRENSATTTVNALCAFDAAGLATGLTWFDFGSQVDSVNGVVAPGYPGDTWIFFFNDDVSNFGASDTLLRDGDSILWTLGIQPLHITVSDASPTVGGTTTVTVTGFDTGTFAFVPAADATVVGVEGTTDVNGQLDIVATSTDALTIYATQTGYLPSATTSITAVAAETPAPVANSGGGGGEVVHIKLNVPNALTYLVSKQGADGSFGSPLYSDWVAVAFAASDPGAPKTLLRDYLIATTPALSSVTDYERHAMALMALGINPYNGTSRDYITPIVNAFDGTQIGDVSFENDDIFALFPLTHAGYSASDDIVQKTAAFIISRQLESGAWTGGVDMTAAAVQALAPLSSLPGVPAALTKAEGYLRAQQQTNGGFGSSFSTSWALQAISALGQSSLSWTANGLTPGDYLASLQQAGGGIEPTASDESTRIWATAYVIPASLGKTWNSLLSSFPKPSSPSGSGAVLGTSTSTIPIATSTPEIISTSTPEIISTSTPAVLEIVQGITTTLSTSSGQAATTTPVKPKPKIVKVPQPKKVVLPQVATTSSSTPPMTSSQTAAAATANPSKGGFLSGLWRSIVSFFGRLF
ncbi:MAG: prenyltransferase/squalene oxidase repeat-containing protein [bacterium]|nr:prenyltransferase/squalene oxidase repeat-containing protein [bacterium]